MSTPAKVTRVRRTYNTWVANQTLEDFALRFTAHKVRRWSPMRIANTAIGAVSFLALEAIGGALTLNYGFSITLWAVLSTCLVIFMLGIPISYHCAKYGVDIDLLTRGAGFGYLGSTITSLIYASFTFIFFAIEAAIMATALELCFGVPLPIGYLMSTLIVIPMVTHGITFINKLQAWTQPFWIVLQLAPFVFIASQSLDSVRAWTGYTGLFGQVDASFSLPLFGAASAVMFSLVAQIGEQVDYLRFLPRKMHQNRIAWWAALLAAGPGWIVIGSLKVLAGSFLAYYAFHAGVPFGQADEPTQMYLTVFQQMVSSPELALGITGIFVVICQIKINVTNTYAGSIAWSNFFSRLTHSHPGRVVWVVFNVLIGLMLIEFGVYKAFEQVLGLYAIVAVSWLASIVADLVINKPLGLSPKRIEFKRAYLYDINPVGFGSVAVSSALSLMSYFGVFGPEAAALYSYVALGASFVMVPLIAWATKGRYYLARNTQSPLQDEAIKAGAATQCCICEHEFEPEDMATCPVYRGAICSLCCSLDSRCGDRCKQGARVSEQLTGFVHHVFPKKLAKIVDSRLGRYLASLFIVSGLIALVLLIFYYESALDSSAPLDVITPIFFKLFTVLFIISGIVVWLFVLAHESRVFAEDEALKHTTLLLEEIEAHEETDRLLQKAKEAAESANLAKSKYIVGLSHELRTPLNSILGYAQLLDRQQDKTPVVANAARTIRRSGEHLAGMIEGLLDISKIEAGRLHIYRDKTALKPYLDQLVDMFTLQCRERGITFNFQSSENIPAYVYTDEKRLRQILINLLSNAVKFTDAGEVTLRVRYRNQIAVFEITDTGIGIKPEDIERVFLPFERAQGPSERQGAPGTGLGLTITKLLVEIMGGELLISSTPGAGTTFTVRLMLSSAVSPEKRHRTDQPIRGYQGKQRTVLVADDDPAQRTLVHDVLTPLGFNVQSVSDGDACVSALEKQRPDILILDIAMPGRDGWQVAEVARGTLYPDLPVIMISADAGMERAKPEFQRLHDGYLIKPFSLDDLIELIGSTLHLEWDYAALDNREAEIDA